MKISALQFHCIFSEKRYMILLLSVSGFVCGIREVVWVITESVPWNIVVIIQTTSKKKSIIVHFPRLSRLRVKGGRWIYTSAFLGSSLISTSCSYGGKVMLDCSGKSFHDVNEDMEGRIPEDFTPSGTP